ncbi:hypothetical protein CLAVI_000113 [Candidatus Clavichlamydia salmonicola]|nr:hypothetical protein [Candidatus Clavichlamydia salmonicola]
MLAIPVQITVKKEYHRDALHIYNTAALKIAYNSKGIVEKKYRKIILLVIRALK